MDPAETTSPVVEETTTSNGVTLTVSRTVAPHIATPRPTTATASFAEEDGDDAVALVFPWDSRIQYSPDSSWVSTTSSSSIGNCHNGTKAANQVGASIKFAFEGTLVPSINGIN